MGVRGCGVGERGVFFSENPNFKKRIFFSFFSGGGGIGWAG